MKNAANSGWSPDWTGISDEAVEILLQEAKEQLQGTIDLGINADQRSAALCGVFGGGAFAMFAVCATLFSSEHANTAFQWVTAGAGVVLLIACFICATAAMPSDFYVGGYEPKMLFSARSEILWMRLYTIEDIQRRIDANRAEIKRESSLIKSAIWVAGAALLIIAVGVVLIVFGVIHTTPK